MKNIFMKSKKDKLNMTKKAAEFLHAAKRGKERYGLSLADIVDIKQRHGLCSKFEKEQSKRVVVHTQDFNGVKVWYCWDKKRQEIITFLPGPPERQVRENT